MKVGRAREAAVDWVTRYARVRPDFRGAYVTGSTLALERDADLAPTSDVDVVVLVDRAEAPPKPGKLEHRGALLEVTYEPWSTVVSPETVLGDYHRAGPFVRDCVLADPTGRLALLRERVARDFADRFWVRRRCAQAEERVRDGLGALDAAAPFHEQVTAWLFPTGVSAHVLLVAALRNPTIRLRYPAAREVLSDFGRLDLYPALLDSLGCARLPARVVRRHLATLAETFDATAGTARTPFPFSSDLTARARPIAVAGGAALIADGLHREAVFWIVATLARCHTALAADAPHEHARRWPAFAGVLADLGIHTPADLRRRARSTVRDLLPRVSAAAEEIRAAHPGIRGRGGHPPLTTSDGSSAVM
ncbi:hypothetical protein [Streptomyces sp. NPDC007088]|uniref:hypothetical protein n=1 Tax=Streptomyces sp. NPDC007088 TaxID=3364773 RepID=UPI0036BFCC32